MAAIRACMAAWRSSMAGVDESAGGREGATGTAAGEEPAAFWAILAFMAAILSAADSAGAGDAGGAVVVGAGVAVDADLIAMLALIAAIRSAASLFFLSISSSLPAGAGEPLLERERFVSLFSRPPGGKGRFSGILVRVVVGVIGIPPRQYAQIASSSGGCALCMEWPMSTIQSGDNQSMMF